MLEVRTNEKRTDFFIFSSKLEPNPTTQPSRNCRSPRPRGSVATLALFWPAPDFWNRSNIRLIFLLLFGLESFFWAARTKKSTFRKSALAPPKNGRPLSGIESTAPLPKLGITLCCSCVLQKYEPGFRYRLFSPLGTYRYGTGIQYKNKYIRTILVPSICVSYA